MPSFLAYNAMLSANQGNQAFLQVCMTREARRYRPKVCVSRNSKKFLTHAERGVNIDRSTHGERFPDAIEERKKGGGEAVFVNHF